MEPQQDNKDSPRPEKNSDVLPANSNTPFVSETDKEEEIKSRLDKIISFIVNKFPSGLIVAGTFTLIGLVIAYAVLYTLAATHTLSNNEIASIKSLVPLPGVSSGGASSTNNTAGGTSASSNGSSGSSSNHVSSGSGGSGGNGSSGTKIFAYEPAGSVSSNTIGVANNPYVAGISWVFHWSDIEGSENNYNWQPIDQDIKTAASMHKIVMLRVISGLYTPNWVYGDGAKGVKVSSLGGTSGTMPEPWDPVYLQKWTAFIAAYGKRYNGNSEIYSIQMPGGGIYGEMILPNLATGTWPDYGYSDSAETSAWETIISAYRNAFPNTPTSLDIDKPLSNDSSVLNNVISWSKSNYGNMVWLQQNGLKPTYINLKGTYASIISNSSSYTTVGYQEGDGQKHFDGAELLQAFQAAKAAHVSYIEVYPFDITSTNNSALSYITSP